MCTACPPWWRSMMLRRLELRWSNRWSIHCWAACSTLACRWWHLQESCLSPQSHDTKMNCAYYSNHSSLHVLWYKYLKQFSVSLVGTIVIKLKSWDIISHLCCCHNSTSCSSFSVFHLDLEIVYSFMFAAIFGQNGPIGDASLSARSHWLLRVFHRRQPDMESKKVKGNQAQNLS